MGARCVLVWVAVALRAIDAQVCPDGVSAVSAEDSCLLQVSGAESMREKEQRIVEEFLQQSEHLSEQFAGLSRASAFNRTTRHLMSLLRVCGRCDKFERFGEKYDGGYLMCMDGLRSGMKAAFSAGVDTHDKWSHDMAALLRRAGNTGIVVHQFDCTVPAGQDCPGCVFHKVCIAPEGEAHDEYWSLGRVMRETGLEDAPDRSLILKMDIEGAEWPTLASLRPGILGKFRQVVVEFHHLEQEERHALMVSAITPLLDGGFRVVHMHGNNCCGMFSAPGTHYSVPSVVEVTFMADASRIMCENEQKAHPLDADNVRNFSLHPRLPMAHLPAMHSTHGSHLSGGPAA